MTKNKLKAETAKKPDNSLENRVFRHSLIGFFLLGLVLLVIFLGLYSHSLAQQYIAEAVATVKSTRLAVFFQEINLDPMIEDILEVYENQSEEERKQTGTAEYRARFSHFTETLDYEWLNSVIAYQAKDSPQTDVYLAVLDDELDTMVYICDPDDAGRVDYMPGEWEDIEQSEIDKFNQGDWETNLYDISNTELYGWMATCGVPVYFGSNQRYIGYIFGDVSLRSLISGVLHVAARYIVGLIIATLAIGLIMMRRMRQAFVLPVNRIAEAAGRYAADRRNGIVSGSHFGTLDVGVTDELINLRDVMADMEKGINEYENNMTRITAERERIRTELGLAARIQSDALPDVPAFPERNEFSIYASMTPAKEIGGDFYDFFLIDEDHLCIVIADVSGKGIPASLFMMASKIVIADNAKSGRSPAEIMEAANRVITHDNSEKMFVTAWVGILEISTGILTAANAGHEYPALAASEGGFEIYKDRHGFILGGLENMKYKEYQITLKPGSSLFLYTDGVPEGNNTAGEMFGTERMLKALNKDPHADAEAVIANVQGALDKFTGEAETFDDETMVCLKYAGPPPAPYKEIKLAAKEENLETATEFVNGIMEENEASFKAMTQVDIVIDEIFSNIVRYGYENTGGEITLRAQADGGMLKLTFIDSGVEFNPLNTDSPDISLGADEREVGGLGIFLVRKTMDSLSYRYENGQNILTVEKKI